MFYSPSAIENFDQLCNRYWFLKDVLGAEVPAPGGAELGLEFHYATLDQYLLTGQFPAEGTPLPGSDTGAMVSGKALRMAQAVSTYLPRPPWPRERVEVKYALPGTSLKIDFIDYVLEGTVWVPRVNDLKSTSDFKYARTLDQLRWDPQALFYAACYAGPRNPCYARWLYVHKKSFKVLPVEIRFEAGEVASRIGDHLAQVMRRMDETRLQSDPREVRANTASCGKYRGCFFRPRCQRLGTDVYGDAFNQR